MRVVHLCYYYGNNTSGAPIAATRLHKALLRAGVESHFICVEQRDPGENIHVLPKSTLANRLFYLAVRAFWVASKVLTGRMLMPNILPLIGLKNTIKAIDPDVIHVQYVGQDMMSFRQLASLPQPKVFTLHDLSIINALEPYPRDDKRFLDGFNRGNSSVIERWMFRRKLELVLKAGMVFTGPSKWVCDLFRKSIIGKGHRVCEVPNVVDPVYSYDAALRVRHEKFTILFGAYGGRRSPYKGWADLEAALRLLPKEIKEDTKVCVFGEDESPSSIDEVELVFLGAIKEPARLKAIHHAADVFAFPSTNETFGQTKVEAMANGLPVLAFRRTGCAEYISHKQNGWVSPDGDLQDYSNGIAFFYHLYKSGELDALRGEIAEKAKAVFNETVIVNQMIKVYQSCRARPVANTCGPALRQ